MNVLVTGGAGYIGSHTVLELLNLNHKVVVIDNLSTGNKLSLAAVKRITGRSVRFYRLDCRDKVALDTVFSRHAIDCVLHFAAFKSVGESMRDSHRYYHNNLGSLITLLDVMQEHSVKRLIFSSSCTVYGNSDRLPVNELTPVGSNIVSAYGRTKYFAEEILKDLAASDSSWQITSLRYFNVVGADASGLMGEDPNGTPNFLMPYIAQVAVGKLDVLHVFGNNYATPDGTCIRDYIHVTDVAKGHVAAMGHLASGFAMYNLGTGKGVSVLEMIRAFEKASGRRIPYKFEQHRPGDVTATYADPHKANQQLGWRATKTIDDACTDTWRWQSTHPDGFTS